MVVHRRFTPELKARVVLELISGAASLAEACRQYNLKAPDRLSMESRIPGEGTPTLPGQGAK
jgi:transposase-like protein